MLIKQNIEFELIGPGPSGRTCTSITGYFHKKNLKGKSLSVLSFTAKILQKAMFLTSPTWAKYLNHLQIKFNNKLQDF